MIRVAAKAHSEPEFGSEQLPGVSVMQPGVRPLYLPAVFDQLFDNPEFVTYAITDGWNLQGGA